MKNRQTTGLIREFQKLDPGHELFGCRWRPAEIDGLDPMDDPATLGLNYDGYGQLAASHFVGAVRIPAGESRSLPLKVFPKGNDRNQVVDYLEMFFTCLGQPILPGELGRCLHVWPEQDPVQGFSEAPRFSILIVAMFLRELEQFCRRHLRKDFRHRKQNLTGKVKGRILFGGHLKKNFLRGRPDRFYCQYQVLSRDSLENRILRAALTQARRRLSCHAGLLGKSGMSVWGWASTSDAALAGVPLVRIADTDFFRVKLGGLKKAYRRPLYWAKKILKLWGSDPNTDAAPAWDDLPPFAIDMNELFERYCQALLLKEHGTDLWSGYRDFNLGSEIRVRPDFIVKGKKIVFDAKYKYDWGIPWNKLRRKEALRPDVYQLMAYTRHQAIAEMCGRSPGDARAPFEKAVILYPYVQEGDFGHEPYGEENVCKSDFPLLYKRRVGLPLMKQTI